MTQRPNTNTLIQFFGTRRSGNHAISGWLRKNLPYQDLTDNEGHNDVFAPQRRGIRVLTPQDLRVAAPEGGSMLVVNYEDVPLHLIPKLATVRNTDQILENCEIKKVLLLRDPFNTFASRIELMRKVRSEGKTYAINRVRLPQAVAMWKDYAREFLGETHVLGDIIPVNYNSWASDRQYRDALLVTAFGQINQDIGIDDVPYYGRGSSRDGLLFQGNASQMKTDERWIDHRYDPVFTALFRDTEIMDLSLQIFGHIPGTERFKDIYSEPEGVYFGRNKERL